MTVGCVKDFVEVPGSSKIFHKEELGLITVIVDILSIGLMFFVFYKIKRLNDEYIQILDNNVIRMSKFSVEIRNMKINSSS